MPLLFFRVMGWGAPLKNEGGHLDQKVMGILNLDFPVNFNIDPQYNLKNFRLQLFTISVPKSRYLKILNFRGTLISPPILNLERPIFL